MTCSSGRSDTRGESLLANFLEDALNCSAWIGLSRDGAPDHQRVCAIVKSFTWGRNSLLIVRGSPGRTNPGGDDHDAGAELLAQSFDLARARDQAAHARGGAELG